MKHGLIISHQKLSSNTIGNKENSYQSHLPSVTDFLPAQTIDHALNQEFDWDDGVSQIWNLLENDKHRRSQYTRTLVWRCTIVFYERR